MAITRLIIRHGAVALVALLVGVAFATGCDDAAPRSSSPGGAGPPVRVAASVYPLAVLMEEVGGGGVSVHWVGERGRRVTAYGDRGGDGESDGGGDVAPYRPPPRAQEAFRDAQFFAVDGRSDRWALSGLSETALAGPTLQLADMDAARRAYDRGVRGALWLDPMIMADAAREAAERLALLRPEGAGVFRSNADRLAGRLEGLTTGLAPRWRRVATVSAEPGPLLARLGIEPVRVALDPEDVALPDPERLAREARAGGAEAVLLPADWAESTRDAWARRLGMPVAIYDALGSADVADPRSRLIGLMQFNLAELTGPAVQGDATTRPPR